MLDPDTLAPSGSRRGKARGLARAVWNAAAQGLSSFRPAPPLPDAAAGREAVLLFAGPAETERQASDLLRPLGAIRRSPFEARPGEAWLVLDTNITEYAPGHGRADSSTILASLAGWTCRGGIDHSRLREHRLAVQ